MIILGQTGMDRRGEKEKETVTNVTVYIYGKNGGTRGGTLVLAWGTWVQGGVLVFSQSRRPICKQPSRTLAKREGHQATRPQGRKATAAPPVQTHLLQFLEYHDWMAAYVPRVLAVIVVSNCI